jgi:amino acid adenylation domain-containing protein
MANPAQMEPSERGASGTSIETGKPPLVGWKSDSLISQKDSFVPDLVSARAEATPDALAVVAGCDSLTYRELNSRSHQLAYHLHRLGVGPETLVGLCLERSLDFVVAALGILKAGGAYLPLDPAIPKARIASLLADAQISVLITTRRIEKNLSAGDWRLLAIDADWPVIAQHPVQATKIELKAENLAYVIYTSGSSGDSKGVEITHGSLSNLVSWHREAFAVTQADRATQLASPGFDAAVWELWPYLAAGASVHIPEKFTIMAPTSLRDWLVSQRITVSFVPTALAEQLMMLDWPCDVCLRFLLTGADMLRHYPPRNLPFELVNNYGPTECTVVATSGIVPFRESPDRVPPIGKPIAGTRIYILGENQEQVPSLVAGELHIAGAGLARGYRNRADLTAQKFVPNPFGPEPDARMYKTGDLACYLPDGQIAFLGRIDEQVKIRGYRIEPNETATALDRHPSVQMSVVVPWEDVPGEKRLVAYVSLTPDSQVTESELRIFLAKSLPAYMVPSSFVQVNSFPLTVNGKIDHDQLPAPDRINTLREKPIVAPRTLVEERLSGILCRSLRLQSISVEDNFFMLGGHSLLGTQLIARIREAFGVEITLRALFDNPNVAGIAAEVEQLILAKLDMSEARPSSEGAADACAPGD